MPHNQAVRTRSFILLCVISLVWGLAYIATEKALRAGLSPSFIMAFRFLSGAAVILPAARGEWKKRQGRALIKGMAAGVLVMFGFLCQTMGQGLATVSAAGFLTSTNILWIPFVLWAVRRRRPPSHVFVLALVALVGVAILSFKPGERFSFSKGEALVMLGALLFACHIVFLGTACANESPKLITFWQLFWAGVAGLILFLIEGHPISLPVFKAGFLPALYLGIFATGLCYYVQIHAQQHIDPSATGLILSTEGFFGALMSVIWGYETGTWQMAVGGLVIMSTVFISEWKARSALTDTKKPS